MKGRPNSASPPSAPPSGSPPAGAHRPDRGFCYPRGHGRVSRVVVRATALGTFGDVARAAPRSPTQRVLPRGSNGRQNHVVRPR